MKRNLALLSIFLVAGFYPFQRDFSMIPGKAGMKPFDLKEILSDVKLGKRVFVQASARWCLSCKANEFAVLNTPEFYRLSKQHDVVLYYADWTNKNKEILIYLESFQRSGVPLYVYYHPGKKPQVLPQVLNLSIIENTFKTR